MRVSEVDQAPAEGWQDAAVYHCAEGECGSAVVGIDFAGMVVETQR